MRLRKQPESRLATSLRRVSSPEPSKRTQQILRRYDLQYRSPGELQQVLDQLAQIHDVEPGLPIVSALAELSFLAGQQHCSSNCQAALEYYLRCVAYSYGYLFDPRFGERNVFDPQFRETCDLYNSALEKCLRMAHQVGVFRPGRVLQLEYAGRPIKLAIEARGFQWEPEEFDHFEFVSDYEIVGLRNRYQTFGLGVPLIAIHRAGNESPEIDKYYCNGLSFPVTAFLRLQEGAHESEGLLHCTLELHDPLTSDQVSVAGQSVPLESDLSTPLAYFLENPRLQHLDTLGFLFPDRAKPLEGLYMVQPYDPDRIPVLMVHGLWSSPMTWMEMLNDLQSMPDLRERFQFWFYLYPTGQPFYETAADLRELLAEARDVFDPDRTNATFDQTVVVGHSMGGLVARLLTLSGGEAFWSTVSRQPFRAIAASPEVRRDLQRVYFFEPVHSVRRIVTIATPNHGSHLSNSFTKWLARSVIFLPGRTLEAMRQLVDRNPGVESHEETYVPRTSVDGLAINAPILRVMHEAELRSDVVRHNIVGVRDPDAPLDDATDGIVPFTSAHAPRAVSEIVVVAGHSQVHRHPRTVLELRRILREHLDEIDAARFPVVPAHVTRPTRPETIGSPTQRARKGAVGQPEP